MDGGFDPDRFVSAQRAVWAQVKSELAAGRKASHWMWFVFPQLAGLGRSEMARRYGLGSVAEARAYLAHPVLGPRLREAVELLMRHADRPAEAILGATDAMKLRSCLTLFMLAAPDDPLFAAALRAFHAGAPDPATLGLTKE
jgi:uncharacterized protein (DUF1810 family)